MSALCVKRYGCVVDNVDMNTFTLVSGKDILEVDRYVIDQVGIPSLVLMENAGSAVVDALLKDCPTVRSVAIVAGSGNNGADGLVVARKLASLGISVDVFLISHSTTFKSPEGQLQAQLCDKFDICMHAGIPTNIGLKEYDVVVDAVLGAGTQSTSLLPDVFQSAFKEINLAKHVVSVDIPSGICPDTGELLCAHPVRAHTTVTFGLLKKGLIYYPGASFAGTKLILATISYPKCLLIELLTVLNPVPELTERSALGHKGTFGKALFIAGSDQYYGAPLLSSLSFLKSGGGYSRLVTPVSVGAVVATQAPEVVQLGDEWSDTHIQDADVVVIGPGIGLSESAVWKVKRVIEQISKGDTGRLKCVIFDGDALTILGKYYPDWSEVIVQMSGSGVTTILTPHLGEWKRLFDKNVGSEIEMAEISRSAIRNIPNLIVVTKGARTGIVDSKSILVNVTGNDGMATCGSGDVLTGIIGAMVCNMPDVRVAVGAGVFIHGLAGDIAESSLGKDGVTASDIMNKIPGAIEKIRQEKNILQATYFPQIV